MLSSSAHAQSAPEATIPSPTTIAQVETTPMAQAPAKGFDWISMLPMAAVFAIFYFLLIRPQQKKAKEQRDLIDSLKIGDKVITSGGFFARIVKLENDGEVIVEIDDGVRVRMLRQAVSQLITPTKTNNSTVVSMAKPVPSKKKIANRK